MSESRRNVRVMSVKLGIGETVVNVCAHAPHVGCEEEEKETFWRQMDQELKAIPEGERVIERSRDGNAGFYICIALAPLKLCDISAKPFVYV